MKVAQLLTIADLIFQDLGVLIRQARAPTGGPERVQMSLILTISEQYEAVLILAKAHMITHSASHARSMIEALIAIKMLEIDSDYINKMRYENLKGQKKFYEGLFANPDAPEEIKEQLCEGYSKCKSDFSVLHAEGYRPKKISDDFAATKLWNFLGPYSILCAFSHNDLSVLGHRHQTDEGMVFKQVNSADIVLSIISSSVNVVIQAAGQLAEVAKFTSEDFSEIFERMNMNWRAILSGSVEN